MILPKIDIDEEAESLIANTPQKSEGVNVNDLLQPSENEQVAPVAPANQEKKKSAKEYQREYQKKYRELRKQGKKPKKASLAPQPKGLSDEIEESNNAPSAPANANENDSQEKKKIPVEASARIINTAYESLLQGVLGSHVELTGQERIALDSALIEYLKISNYDIPPAWALAFAYGAVTVSKIQQPQSRERMAGLIGYIKGKFGRKKSGTAQNA